MSWAVERSVIRKPKMPMEPQPKSFTNLICASNMPDGVGPSAPKPEKANELAVNTSAKINRTFSTFWRIASVSVLRPMVKMR